MSNDDISKNIVETEINILNDSFSELLESINLIQASTSKIAINPEIVKITTETMADFYKLINKKTKEIKAKSVIDFLLKLKDIMEKKELALQNKFQEYLTNNKGETTETEDEKKELKEKLLDFFPKQTGYSLNMRIGQTYSQAVDVLKAKFLKTFGPEINKRTTISVHDPRDIINRRIRKAVSDVLYITIYLDGKKITNFDFTVYGR